MGLGAVPYLKDLLDKDLIVGLETLRPNMLCYEELWLRKEFDAVRQSRETVRESHVLCYR